MSFWVSALISSDNASHKGFLSRRLMASLNDLGVESAHRVDAGQAEVHVVEETRYT